ncbi:MAG: threonine export protein RhtC [marine bacterium B5-7]|nr:MAG: threonine export protein RhtC [marine bacterium B5-7]
MFELNANVSGILLSLSALMLALMSPGPNILAVIGTSMGVGRKEGVALALGVSFGTFIWVTLTVMGFTAIIASYAQIMFALKILGGCYLLWLGYKSLRSAATRRNVQETAVVLHGGPRAYFARGLTVQMTNPKAALAMIAIVSIGITIDAPLWVGATIIIGATVLSIGGHLMYALAFSTKPIVALYAKTRRFVEAALGTFFCAMGIRLLSDRS